jgi:prepilin-type N-terminal cleavage/methylation domain-containing protein
MSHKKGFTLIELLIVVVIIGILAAIAIPKFANTKDKAYVAAMKSDLRNLATYEEQYAADNNRDDVDTDAGLYAFAERDHYRRTYCRPATGLEREQRSLAVCQDLHQRHRRDRLHLRQDLSLR